MSEGSPGAEPGGGGGGGVPYPGGSVAVDITGEPLDSVHFDRVPADSLINWGKDHLIFDLGILGSMLLIF